MIPHRRPHHFLPVLGAKSASVRTQSTSTQTTRTTMRHHPQGRARVRTFFFSLHSADQYNAPLQANALHARSTTIVSKRDSVARVYRHANILILQVPHWHNNPRQWAPMGSSPTSRSWTLTSLKRLVGRNAAATSTISSTSHSFVIPTIRSVANASLARMCFFCV